MPGMEVEDVYRLRTDEAEENLGRLREGFRSVGDAAQESGRAADSAGQSYSRAGAAGGPGGGGGGGGGIFAAGGGYAARGIIGRLIPGAGRGLMLSRAASLLGAGTATAAGVGVGAATLYGGSWAAGKISDSWAPEKYDNPLVRAALAEYESRPDMGAIGSFGRFASGIGLGGAVRAGTRLRGERSELTDPAKAAEYLVAAEAEKREQQRVMNAQLLAAWRTARGVENMGREYRSLPRIG